MKYLYIMCLFSFLGCKAQPLEVVKEVDLTKYAGRWYEISAFPQYFEKGCSCTQAEYIITDKGFVKVVNTCIKSGKLSSIEGKAFISRKSNAKLKVQFFWPFKGKYWIIDLANDYSYAVVGHPNRKYLWILSRTPQMNEAVYNSLLEKIKAKGFDITKIKRTTQECK